MTKPKLKSERKGTLREAILLALPGTQRHLRQETGGSIASISRWVAFLRGTNEMHVGGWEPAIGPSGPPQCVFHAGPGADVVCTIRALTPAEIARRKTEAYRDRELLSRKRVLRGFLKKPMRDPFTAAFFGPAGKA